MALVLQVEAEKAVLAAAQVVRIVAVRAVLPHPKLEAALVLECLVAFYAELRLTNAIAAKAVLAHWG